MFIFVIILAVLTQSLVALFVLQKNYKSLNNILFFVLSVFLVIWAVINFIITNNPFSSEQIVLYRLLMASVVAQNTFFFLFAHTYPDREINLKPKYVNMYIALSVVTVLVALSPLLFVKVTYGSAGARPVAGPGMLIFILHAGISVISGLHSIYKRYSKAKGITKQQFRLIFIGSVILWGIVPVTNFVIPLATKTLFFSRISPIYTLAFYSIIAYAIIAQKLFDIRAAVARSVGYLMITAVIIVVYGFGLFGVIDVLFRGNNHEFLRQVLSVVLITPLALIFQRTKQFFDRITNRLFYRDAYDTQDVLDRLGNVLVTEIDLYKLTKDTREVLSSALRSSFIEFVLFKEDKPYFETHTHKTISESILTLGTNIRNQQQELLVTDELPQHQTLRQDFINAGVALSLQLKTKEQVVGYIIFGAKKSGDIYSQQDRKLLVIVANELAITIQNALRFEEIENFNITLQGKVDEATRKLRRVNERLKTLDETKDDFISMASHQLRTPLTSVKGYISMVLEGDAGKISPTQKKLLTQSFFSSQRMVYLIADLLNVSRLKTGKFVIETAPVNLAEVVEQELEQLKETAAAHSLKLTYEKPKHFPELMLDETKTRQVIMNFVDNAIYYTPSGGHINVRLADNPTTVELKVEDNGIGVPRGEQPHLFTKFYRAGNARKARPDGTGLGIFMAKKVVVAQGGSIIFESHEGKGSTFGFIFSKHRLAVPAAAQTQPQPPVTAVKP
jgi:signal transduction histidine kinase